MNKLERQVVDMIKDGKEPSEVHALLTSEGILDSKAMIIMLKCIGTAVEELEKEAEADNVTEELGNTKEDAELEEYQKLLNDIADVKFKLFTIARKSPVGPETIDDVIKNAKQTLEEGKAVLELAELSLK